MKAIIFSSLLCLSTLVHANTVCNTEPASFENLACLNKNYQQANKEVSIYFKKLKNKLDKEGKDLLNNGQLTWLEQRNESCIKNEADELFFNINCAINMSIERSRFIQERLHECLNTTCQNNKL
ncbi:MAG: lysozyme inhibitor LprI family protein [Methylococcaceae bacterium]